jgi:3-hydroxyisobutyrate dehydrogenase
VLGSTGPARQGTLTWLVGGADGPLERALPVLEALGTVLHLGPDQQGSRLKAVLNVWLATATVAMADALTALDALDVPRDAFLDVLRNGPLGMAYAVQKAALMASHDYAPGFPVELALKDVRLSLDAVGDQPLAAAVAARLQEEVDAGHARDDLAAVADVPASRT